jgi:hypothetical protein
MECVRNRESAPMRRLPHPADGDQAAAFDIRTDPHVAQDLVAGLESPSSKDLLLRRQGWHACLNPTGLISTNDPDSIKSFKEKIKWKTQASQTSISEP